MLENDKYFHIIVKLSGILRIPHFFEKNDFFVNFFQLSHILSSKNRADIIVCRLFGFGSTKFYRDFSKNSMWRLKTQKILKSQYSFYLGNFTKYNIN